MGDRNPMGDSESSELSQAVFAFDLIFGEATDAGQGAAAVGYGYGYHDFVGAGGVVEADFHAVEVAADEGGVFVAQGDIEDYAHAAALFGRWNQRGAFAENFSDGRA